jgi:hypothetical protein
VPNTALTIPGKNIALLGASVGKTTLHLLDTQTDNVSRPYLALVYASTQTDVSGLSVSNITFDGNSTYKVTQQEHDDMYNGLCATCQDCGIAIWTGQGSPQSIVSSNFTNLDDEGVLDLNGGTISVENDSFTNIGAGQYHDHSSVYVCADSLTISGNFFSGAGAAATTAIETHPGFNPPPPDTITQVVTQNIVKNYTQGMNLSGLGYFPTSGVRVTNNQMSHVAVGIDMWAWPVFPQSQPCNQAPFGDLSLCFGDTFALKDVLIDGNTIDLDIPGNPTPAQFGGGIVLYPYSTLGLQNVTISNNQTTGLVASNAGPAGPAPVGPAGVSITRATNAYCVELPETCTSSNCVGGTCDPPPNTNWCCSAPAPQHIFMHADERIAITGNTITNMLSAGIVLQPEGAAVTGLSLMNNTITDPGDGFQLQQPPFARDYVDGIVLDSDGTTSFVSVGLTGNSVYDDRTPTVARFGIDLYGALLSQNQANVSGNRLFYGTPPSTNGCVLRQPNGVTLAPPPTNEPPPCQPPWPQ